MLTPQVQAAQALKSIARSEHIKSYLQQSEELYPLVLQATKRFITGESRQDGITVAKEMIRKGYAVSLEYIGENIKGAGECHEAKEEFLQLIEEMGAASINQTVSLDLSHIGLLVDTEITYTHLVELAEKAKSYNITVMVSMEESSKTDDILDIYKRAVRHYSNVGISIQAHLYRSVQDLRELMDYPGKIRIVKGAYQEPCNVAIPRSKELNDRYLQLVEQVMEANHPLSIATHDESLIQQIEQRHCLARSHVEVEMLYGIRPDLLKNAKDNGYTARMYLTYGQEWYLYLCHRLAEYPENLYLALTDMIGPPATNKYGSY
ncbi:proline dehydrogenase family protein [Aneurinibacillus migulanus]|uniref:proline dehydrogenase family protein n=1 Tax=Aneurinibacillus migulanus TaxID=47500 RepID=UPI002E226560|nr:proline dehydrogenase family protein [Aneurinibacillus migulanus]